MFGYVTPLKPELKIKDYNMFRGYYCGLCHGIKKTYGNIPRMALNYDITFLAVLLDSLTENPTSFSNIRCSLHPLKERPIVCNNNAIEYASSINVILFYYKLVDDFIDDKDLKSKCGTMLLNSAKKTFEKNYSNLNTIIKNNLKDLDYLEKNKNFSSLDEISHPFADLTGTLLKSYPHKLNNDDSNLRDTLYFLGYNLGKWIYIIDALDDLEDDMKKDKFNPINYLYNKESLSYDSLFELIKPRIDFILINCSYSCLNSLNKLQPSKNFDILHNILHLGIMHKNHIIINKCNKNCKNTNNT